MKTSGAFCFFCGLTAGAIAGLLYAPKKGVKMRAELRSKAKKSRNFIRDRADRLRERAIEGVERGREELWRRTSDAADAFEHARRAFLG
jgi:gas vesicle protein